MCFIGLKKSNLAVRSCSIKTRLCVAMCVCTELDSTLGYSQPNLFQSRSQSPRRKLIAERFTDFINACMDFQSSSSISSKVEEKALTRLEDSTKEGSFKTSKMEVVIEDETQLSLCDKETEEGGSISE